MELKKAKNKNQETDGFETDKRPRTEELKRKEITVTEKLQKKTETEKSRHAVRVKRHVAYMYTLSVVGVEDYTPPHIKIIIRKHVCF